MIFSRHLARAVFGAWLAVAVLLSHAVHAHSIVEAAEFHSTTLKRTWTYNVYLPDGYHKRSDLYYPVLYLLHGNGGARNDWPVKGQMQRTVDHLIRRGEMPPAIIVMPDAGTTWYVDLKEPMETAFFQDMVPHIEAKYRALASRDARVIGGLSMGSYGALRYVLKYPEMFQSAALLSPAIYNPEPPTDSSARFVKVFAEPNTDGQYSAAVWQAYNYPALFDAFLKRGITVPMYINSGDDDDFMIESEATRLYSLLRSNKQPAELRIVNGKHEWSVWESTLGDALKYVFRTVRRPQASNAAAPQTAQTTPTSNSLWQIYDQTFRTAKYIDLSHVITPQMPVWRGFAQPQFSASVAARNLPDFATAGETFTFAKHGFEATSYVLPTDQLGTQLDPPAHWAPEYAAIDEIPVTYSLRPLVVISIVDHVARDPGYNLQVRDIEAFEAKYGRIPAGAVVMVRSDWSKGWLDPAQTSKTPFPGVGLGALKFLHLERNILFHGHEPLDTDASPTLEGEHWLLHNGFAQAEGVNNLDQVKETGCLLQTGFPKFKGGVGGYARYVAICPPDWPHGVRVGELQEVPLPKFDKPLVWNEQAETRVRE